MRKIVLATLLVAFAVPALAQTKPMSEEDCKKMDDKMKMEECMKMIKK